MKPKNIFQITGIGVLAVMALLGCTQTDDLSGSGADNLPINLQISTLQAADISSGVTRAASTIDYPTGQSIGFFVKADAPKGYKERNNSQGIYDVARKAWVPTPDSIWMNKNAADIAVYAPYAAAQTIAGKLQLTSSIRPSDGSKDIWYKRFTADRTNAHHPVLTLTHVYTRLVISVTRNSNYTASANLTSISLTGNGIYSGTTFNLFADAPYAYDGIAGFTSAFTTQTVNAATPTAVIDMLLIPASLADHPLLTLTVDGKEMKVILPRSSFTSSKFEAGKQYNVSIMLKPAALEVDEVTVVKWGTLPEVNGGNAEFDAI